MLFLVLAAASIAAALPTIGFPGTGLVSGGNPLVPFSCQQVPGLGVRNRLRGVVLNDEVVLKEPCFNVEATRVRYRSSYSKGKNNEICCCSYRNFPEASTDESGYQNPTGQPSSSPNEQPRNTRTGLPAFDSLSEEEVQGILENMCI